MTISGYTTFISPDATVDPISIVEESRLADDVHVRGSVCIAESDIGVDSDIGHPSTVPTMSVSGARVPLSDRREDDSFAIDINGSHIGAGANIGYSPDATGIRISFSTLGEQVNVESGVEIDDSVLGKSCSVQEGTKIDKARIGDYVTFEPHVEVGDALLPCEPADREIIIGDGVIVGAYAKIGPGARIGPNAVIGAEAVIMPGALVDENVKVDAGSTVGAERQKAIVDLGYAAGLAPGAWVLARLAEVASEDPTQRLTKKAIRSERPELLAHKIVKEALRVQPPITADQLEELSLEEALPGKYAVRLDKDGWDGGQQFTYRADDVLLFDLTPEAIRAFAEEESDDVPMRTAVMELLLMEGKSEWHPGGEDPLNVGWARLLPYPQHQTLLVEEMQSDLWIIVRRRRVLRAGGAIYSVPGTRRESDSVKRMIGKIGRRVAKERGEPLFDETATDDDLIYIETQVRGYLSDFYPSLLAFILDYARDNGMEWVLVPDYKTKYAVAGEHGEGPPRSIYESLPKKFQPTIRQGAEEWMELVKLYNPDTDEPVTPGFRAIRTNPGDDE